MIHSDVDEVIAEQFGQIQWLVLLMASPIVLYIILVVGVVHYFGWLPNPAADGWRAPVYISIVLLFLVLWIGNTHLLARYRSVTPRAVGFQRYVRYVLLRTLWCELPTLGGVVLYLLTRSWLDLIVPVAVTGVMMVLFFPREREFVRWDGD